MSLFSQIASCLWQTEADSLTTLWGWRFWLIPLDSGTAEPPLRHEESIQQRYTICLIILKVPCPGSLQDKFQVAVWLSNVTMHQRWETPLSLETGGGTWCPGVGWGKWVSFLYPVSCQQSCLWCVYACVCFYFYMDTNCSNEEEGGFLYFYMLSCLINYFNKMTDRWTLKFTAICSSTIQYHWYKGICLQIKPSA